MTRRTLIGMLPPAPNTTLEPVSSTTLADLRDVGAHADRLHATGVNASRVKGADNPVQEVA